MAAPDSYTEASLGTYLLEVLQDVAAALGWTVLADVQEAVNETLLAYGVDDIALVTGRNNIKRLRALARVQIWRQVLAVTAGDYDFSADGGDYSRSQMHEMAKENLSLAVSDALEFDPHYRIGLDRVTYVHDPYIWLDEEGRAL